ncbi:MAG: putative peptidoglycan glycosyltransferase FtsW [Clostridia bacterium]|nr:putative peptidoglycan glycosyltransferase FtsW [Clostridia bacterium]
MNSRDYYNRKTDHIRRKGNSRKSSGGVSSFIEWFRPVKGKPDYMFLTVVILLLTYGIIMLYSAGSARAYTNFGDSFWYLKNQLQGIALGALAMYATSKFDYHRFGGKIAFGFYIFCGILLLLVIAGFGTTVNGATRWLLGFQPSEIAKIAIIMLFAYTLSNAEAQKDIKSIKYSFLPHMALVGIYAILLLLEPHFSCTVLIGLTACLIMYVAGTPIKHFLALVVAVIPVGVGLIIAEPYRLARILNFADPFADMQGGGWQVAQSLYAIGSGGIFGVGLGNSRQKFQSLPEPYNDFIFSVLCEELGLIGAILLIALFVILMIRGIKIALKAPDLFGTLLCVGFVGIVIIQAAFNIAVVTASVPNTGIPLPFFSYGSTALVITMAEMGIVLNVSRQSKIPN